MVTESPTTRRGDDTLIQRADEGARRWSLVLLLIGIGLGALLIAVACSNLPVFDEWLRRHPEKAGRWAGSVVLALPLLLFLPLGVVAVYLARLSRLVMRHERFPPPGVSVIRDTRILDGAAARRVGARLRWAAWGIAAIGVISALVAGQILRRLLETIGF